MAAVRGRSRRHMALQRLHWSASYGKKVGHVSLYIINVVFEKLSTFSASLTLIPILNPPVVPTLTFVGTAGVTTTVHVAQSCGLNFDVRGVYGSP